MRFMLAYIERTELMNMYRWLETRRPAAQVTFPYSPSDMYVANISY